MEIVRHVDVEAGRVQRAREARAARIAADRRARERHLHAAFVAAGGNESQWSERGPALIAEDLARAAVRDRDRARAKFSQRY